MAASSIWEGILARTGGGKAILPARAQGIPAAAVSPQRLLQRAPSRRSVLGARAPLVDERDDDQASATRARGASAKLPCMATATDGAFARRIALLDQNRTSFLSDCQVAPCASRDPHDDTRPRLDRRRPGQRVPSNPQLSQASEQQGLQGRGRRRRHATLKPNPSSVVPCA